MADRGTPNKKWTEDEKTKFLVQAVKQMQAAGGKLNYKKFEVEGRTPKALTHFWDKISKEVAYSKQDGDAGDADDAGDPAEPGSEPSTPAPKRGGATPGSRKRTAQTAAIGEGDDAGEAPATPSVKRQRKAPASKTKAKAKAAAAQAVDVDEDELKEIKAEIKAELKIEEQQQQQNGFDHGET
ncbi:hypothetical protein F4782DRAFT_549328 [Xylaria castorea]|nr:hypothetical protein F4782DRAFT_549328 [Xylaria castorea]